MSIQTTYEYGASFNCMVGRDDAVGGGGEGCTSIDFVSNNLTALKEAMLEDGKMSDEAYRFDDNHDHVKGDVDVGGIVVSVMVTDDDDACVVAVIFTDPQAPVVVE